MELKKEYTVQEVQQIADVHYRTVLRWIREGKLKAHRVQTKSTAEKGVEWRIPSAQLAQFLDLKLYKKA